LQVEQELYENKQNVVLRTFKKWQQLPSCKLITFSADVMYSKYTQQSVMTAVMNGRQRLALHVNTSLFWTYVGFSTELPSVPSRWCIIVG
jgi:hypothetical protein